MKKIIFILFVLVGFLSQGQIMQHGMFVLAGQGPGANPGKTDLVSYYAFEESSGTDCFDSHTGGFDGTIVNALVNQTGKVGKCYQYDFGDYVTFGNVFSFPSSSSFTISAWIYCFDNNRDDEQKIYAKSGNYALGTLKNTDGEIRLHNSTQRDETGETYILNQQWMHCMFVIDGINTNVYFDGVLRITRTDASLTSNTNPFYIGGTWKVDGTLVTEEWGGWIDELSIFDIALTGDNALWFYNSGNGRSFSDL